MGPGPFTLLYKPQAHNVLAQSPRAKDTTLVGHVIFQRLFRDARLMQFRAHNGPCPRADPGEILILSRDGDHCRARIVTGRRHDSHRARAGLFGDVRKERPNRCPGLGDRAEEMRRDVHRLDHRPGPIPFARVKTLGGRGVCEFVGDPAAQPVVEQVGDGQKGFCDIEHGRFAD